MGTYLFHRTNNLQGALSFPLNFILETVAMLMKSVGDQTEATRQQYIRTISSLVGKKYWWAFYCVTNTDLD